MSGVVVEIRLPSAGNRGVRLLPGKWGLRWVEVGDCRVRVGVSFPPVGFSCPPGRNRVQLLDGQMIVRLAVDVDVAENEVRVVTFVPPMKYLFANPEHAHELKAVID